VYDLRSKNAVCQLDTGSSLQCPDFDAKGTVLAVGKDDGVVDMFDLRHGQLRPGASVTVAARHAVQSMRFAPTAQQGGQQRVFVVPTMPPTALEKFVLAAEATEVMEAEATETPPLMQKQLAESLFSPMRGEAAPKSPLISSVFHSSPLGGDTLAGAPKPWESAGGVVAIISQEVEGTPAETPLVRRDLQHQQQPRDWLPPSPTEGKAQEQTLPLKQSEVVQSVAMEQIICSVKLQMHRQMRALYLDMLRAFHEQQQETKRLEAIIEELTVENLRLRMNTNQL
jgi:hypothetical protein